MFFLTKSNNYCLIRRKIRANPKFDANISVSGETETRSWAKLPKPGETSFAACAKFRNCRNCRNLPKLPKPGEIAETWRNFQNICKEP